jgi:D-amino-acid oxidase
VVSKQEIIIIGCGVSALSSGIKLLERFPVKIIAQQIPPNTTSDVAAAFWKPFKGLQQERIRQWSKISLDEFYLLANKVGSGVSINTLIHLVGPEAEPPWWMDLTHNSRPVTPAELPAGFSSGYAIEVPKIETPIYMPYLIQRFKELGGIIEQVKEPLRISDLYGKHRIIVNCTGIGARDFCSDSEVFPIRGQVIRISALGIKSMIDYDTKPTYIVPRTDDCILGGTAQENNWNVEPDPKDAASIIEHCQKLSPALNNFKILEHKVGLRPGRKEVRLEIETITDTCAVVHNYGHGRAGFTLSWGCAREVFELVTSIV